MKVLSDCVPLSRFLYEDTPCTDKAVYIAKNCTEEQTKEALKRAGDIILADSRAGLPFSETESKVSELAQTMGIKVNGCFQPIRVAITASTVSLPLHDSIVLLGLEETEKRIRRAQELFN